MTGIYAAALVLGLAGLTSRLVSTALGRVDPRRSAKERWLIGGLIGLGMAGLSASFAGWPGWAALAAAAAGAGAAGWYAGRAG